MVNLGVSKDASASDLMTRESVYSAGSAVRKTLVIKDDGKLPTHFVRVAGIGLWANVG